MITFGYSYTARHWIVNAFIVDMLVFKLKRIKTANRKSLTVEDPRLFNCL